MYRATAVYLFVGIYVLLIGPIGMLWTALSGSTRFIYRLARTCVAMAGWMCRIRVRMRGKEKLPASQTYLFLSNHQGNFDGPILFYATGRDVRALVKQEMMRIPVLSLVLRQVHFVPIDRMDPSRARAGIDEGAQQLRRGLSFFAFPEGTRSRDGRLGAFKKGVFIMAIEAGVPIVPVTINNSRAIQPPGTYAIKPADVELVFHDPIVTEALTVADRDKLVQRTRAAIASALIEPAAD
jgi:1-acyl-sn-glycerol-3-phosphate acyltransferase